MNLTKRLNSINERTSQEQVDELFELLYKSYSGLVGFVSSLYLKDENSIKDIINESFFRLYLNRNKVRNIKAFLTTTAKNLCIDELKNQNKVTPVGDFIEVFETPRETFNEKTIRMLDFLERNFDKKELILFDLHLIKGYTFKEIALKQNVKESAIRVRWHRMILKLRGQVYEK